MRAVFSHVGYHIVHVPDHGGATQFSHLGAAYDALTKAEKETWSRRASINSTGGRVHPLVFNHPISGRRSVWLHLGMTGAVVELKPGVEKASGPEDIRLLDEDEMLQLFNRYNEVLAAAEYSRSHEYEDGDMVVIDNLAISHRASPNAHKSIHEQGLRILHRTTVAGMVNFDADDRFRIPTQVCDSPKCVLSVLPALALIWLMIR